MSEQLNSMQSQLKDAFEDKPGAAKVFFQEFLSTEVFIPLKPKSVVDRKDGPVSPESVYNFISIQFEGNQTIPIFSQLLFLEEWSEQKYAYEKRRISSLLQILDPNTWIYLDAAQEYGREFSPWEIKMLRLGEEGVDAILQLDQESLDSQLEVVSNPKEFDELRDRLGIMFEPYLWVSEARLVNFRSANLDTWTPLLGLLTEGDAEEIADKRQLLLAEIKTLFKEYLPAELSPIITDDLAGPYYALLEQQNPFYIRQESSSRAYSEDIVGSLKKFSRSESD